MPRKVLLALLLAAIIVSVSPSTALLDDQPEFQLGFRLLADQIPERAGSPLENERHNPENGDGLQMTTKGLMVWRKADNWTAFTNGWWTWVNGPYGVQERANYARFEWEADAVLVDGEFVAVEPTRDSAFISGQVPAASPTVVEELASPLGLAATATPNPEFPATWQPDPTATEYANPVTSATAIPTSTPQPTSTRVPTRTPVPTATRQPTATRVPTSTPTLRPTETPTPPGVRSPDPAGSWVTSTASSTRYYCSADSAYWKSWSASNRIWFNSESELLKTYPGRTRHD